MNTFKFQRELDVIFLHQKFGDDIFAARSVLGSFVEVFEQELAILETAYDREKYTAFARVSGRLKRPFQMVGLVDEVKMVDELRAHLASFGVNARQKELASNLLESLRNKFGLFQIEVQRIDKHLETSHEN